MHVDESARPDEGEQDAARVDQTRYTATRAAEAAEASVVGASAPLPAIIAELPDGERLRLALLDILHSMELAAALLPPANGWRMTFYLLSPPLRRQLGLSEPNRLAA